MNYSRLGVDTSDVPAQEGSLKKVKQFRSSAARTFDALFHLSLILTQADLKGSRQVVLSRTHVDRAGPEAGSRAEGHLGFVQDLLSNFRVVRVLRQNLVAHVDGLHVPDRWRPRHGGAPTCARSERTGKKEALGALPLRVHRHGHRWTGTYTVVSRSGHGYLYWLFEGRILNRLRAIQELCTVLYYKSANSRQFAIQNVFFMFFQYFQ